MHRGGWGIRGLTAVGLAAALALAFLGIRYPVVGPSLAQWKWLLLAYAFAASVLPVWLLLQPRDYINSLLLYVGVGAMFVGFAATNPSFAAPARRPLPRRRPTHRALRLRRHRLRSGERLSRAGVVGHLGQADHERGRRPLRRLRRDDRRIAPRADGGPGLHGGLRLARGVAGALRELARRGRARQQHRGVRARHHVLPRDARHPGGDRRARSSP